MVPSLLDELDKSSFNAYTRPPGNERFNLKRIWLSSLDIGFVRLYSTPPRSLRTRSLEFFPIYTHRSDSFLLPRRSHRGPSEIPTLYSHLRECIATRTVTLRLTYRNRYICLSRISPGMWLLVCLCQLFGSLVSILDALESGLCVTRKIRCKLCATYVTHWGRHSGNHGRQNAKETGRVVHSVCVRCNSTQTPPPGWNNESRHVTEAPGRDVPHAHSDVTVSHQSGLSGFWCELFFSLGPCYSEEAWSSESKGPVTTSDTVVVTKIHVLPEAQGPGPTPHRALGWSLHTRTLWTRQDWPTNSKWAAGAGVCLCRIASGEVQWHIFSGRRNEVVRWRGALCLESRVLQLRCSDHSGIWDGHDVPHKW